MRYVEGERVEVRPAFGADPVPLTRDTLIPMVVNQKSAGYTDSARADVPDFDVVGAGDLYVLHQGEMVRGTWFRANRSGAFQFFDSDGETLPIKEGLLHLALVPDDLPIALKG